MQRPARCSDGQTDERPPDCAGQNGDHDAERRGDGYAIQASRPKGQADARLEGCSECHSSETANKRPSLQTRERWTFCGPTHHT